MFQIHLYTNVIYLKRKKHRTIHLLFNVSNSFVQECHLSKKNKIQNNPLIAFTLQIHLIIYMVVGFTTTYAISGYHHWRCEFESRSGEVYSIQHYVIKFVSDLRQVGGFFRVLQFPPPIKLTATIYPKYCWKWR